jgi:hypothetical protein
MSRALVRSGFVHLDFPWEEKGKLLSDQKRGSIGANVKSKMSARNLDRSEAL